MASDPEPAATHRLISFRPFCGRTSVRGFEFLFFTISLCYESLISCFLSKNFSVSQCLCGDFDCGLPPCESEFHPQMSREKLPVPVIYKKPTNLHAKHQKQFRSLREWKPT